MNNEPVTYLKKDESTGLYYECDKEYGFPVYTHPAELTDEEKWKLWGECPNGLVYDRVMLFADLILRKAQEK